MLMLCVGSSCATACGWGGGSMEGWGHALLSSITVMLVPVSIVQAAGQAAQRALPVLRPPVVGPHG